MLSYLQPQLASESMLGLCATSSDEANKSTYPTEDENEILYNSASTSSRITYPHAQHHRSQPVPFVYGHTPTPTYGFGFGFYEDMSSFAGM